MFTALEEVLYTFAAVRPLVVVIDDLQWSRWALLPRLCLQRARERSGPLLVVATYRADEASTALREIVTAPDARLHLNLGRFEHDAVSAMIGGMLAVDEPPAHLVDFLARRSAGNPFFIVAYLHAAIGEGLLTRETGARWHLGGSKETPDLERDLAMPAELADLIALRLRRLGPGALTLVEAGAVLGYEFDADLLFVCAGLTGGMAADELQTLRERQIFEEAGNRCLRFVHAKIRETAYERTPAPKSRELHLRAAQGIESAPRRRARTEPRSRRALRRRRRARTRGRALRARGGPGDYHVLQ